MAKKSFRTFVAVASLSLALTPMGFASGPASNTAPLPGARLAAQELVVGGVLTPLGIAAVIAAGVLVAVAVANINDKSDDAALLAFLAAQNTATATR